MGTIQTLNVVDPVATDAVPAQSVRFHLSLNVADLDKSIAFYRVLFDREPAKCYPDYAKFEMQDPPLVLSLEPQRHAGGGSLNHLGFRVPKTADLIGMQHRLETAGIATTREDGVECCYARQTKFWALDPDRNNWEIYVVEADTEHRGAGKRPVPTPASQEITSESEARTDNVVWEHKLGSPFPTIIPLRNEEAREVLLNGTFNAAPAAGTRDSILRESRRVLRQGGRVVFHGLIADRALPAKNLQLPGPAAAVQYVPTGLEIFDAFHSAGFTALNIQTYSASPVFRCESIALRELLLEARKIDPTPFDLSLEVLYKGPLATVTDDAGNVYRRGERCRIANRSVQLLRDSGLAGGFVFFVPGDDR